MRQIPTSGEICGIDCYQLHERCLVYRAILEWDSNRGSYKRLSTCLRDKPQVLTEKEREGLKAQGLDEYLIQRDIAVQYRPKEAHDEHR